MTIEKTVYFVRHGESIDNAAPVFQSLVSPLSERGLSQASLVAGRLAKSSFEGLISSPLTRAKQTAEVIAEQTGKPVVYSNLFVERQKPTSINGKPFTDKAAQATWQSWNESLYTAGLRVEDGENFDDLMVRADLALKFLEKREESSLVVVTHGYFLRTMIGQMVLGDLLSTEAFRRFQQMAAMENTGICMVRFAAAFQRPEPHWRLWSYNDHAHLDGQI